MRIYVKQLSQCLVSSRCSTNGLFLPLPPSFHHVLFPSSLAPPSLSLQHQVYIAFRVKSKFLHVSVLLLHGTSCTFLNVPAVSFPNSFRFHSPRAVVGGRESALAPYLVLFPLDLMPSGKRTLLPLFGSLSCTGPCSWLGLRRYLLSNSGGGVEVRVSKPETQS